MKRGGLVTVALQGEQGEPRPAPAIQADGFPDLPALMVLPITGTLTDAPPMRVLVEPTLANGLARSQVVVDKPQTPLRTRIGSVFGHLDDPAMPTVNRALALFPGPA